MGQRDIFNVSTKPAIKKGKGYSGPNITSNFAEWTGRKHLWLNVNKAKEMVIDLRKKRTALQPLCVLGVNVDVVGVYRYLDVDRDNRLNWKTNAEALSKKWTSSLIS